MKPILQFVFLCFPFVTFGQLTFESIPGLDDFSLGAVRQSPIGEYFVQAVDDRDHIYTSMDGMVWTRTTLPVDHELYDIQFYEDGTPLLKPERDAHLVRRDGVWHTMNIGGLVEASFIKGDTLFVFHDDHFAYSMDKGQTFVTAFHYNGSLVDHTADLWKFESYYVLHHTAGTQNRLSVFNLSGERVLSDTLDINFGETILYNTCGQVLFVDEDNYYLLEEAGLTYTSGPIADIIPQFHYDTDLLSAGGAYYTREENTIYKANGCNFVWQFYAVNDRIDDSELIWFNHLGEIFLYDTYDDHFAVETNGTAVEHYPGITYPYVKDVDEAENGFQFSLSANALFHKNTDEDNWVKLDPIDSPGSQVHYSPGGDLYIASENEILYSTNNGISFSSLPLPEPGYPIHSYSFEVLDDHFLFLTVQVIGHGFYSMNNGVDWIDTGVSFFNDVPQVKLVGEDILIADSFFDFIFTKIKITTNEVTSEVFSTPPGDLGATTAILDDGTIYLQSSDVFGSGDEELYRYRFGEGLKFVGTRPELNYANIASSGNELYAFGTSEYYELNGETFIEHSYSGLPWNVSKKFIVAENEYLYVIVDQHSIYRSTQPLSLPTSIDPIGALVDFQVFPNPTHGLMTISDPLNTAEKICLSDMMGRPVSFHYNNQEVDLLDAPDGMYILTVKLNTGESVAMKVIKKST